MHTLLGFASVLLVVLGSSFTLHLLQHIRDWLQRRAMQYLVLTMPIVTLGVGIGGLHHFLRGTCFLGIPLWDTLLGVVVPLGMGIVALGAVGLGVVRLLLMARVVTRSGACASRELQALADTLAQQLHAARARVLLCTYDRPLALTCGIVRPTVLLSTWMVEHLDRRELEAVLAHELEHVTQRDYLVIWLATVLRDAFFYLPTSWAAYRQLQHEKELACDDKVVGAMHRPLALASALTKVWLHAIEGPHFARFGTAQPLVAEGEVINHRIERLLTSHDSKTDTPHSRFAAFSISASVLLALMVVQGANLIILLSLMGCNPIALLSKLF